MLGFRLVGPDAKLLCSCWRISRCLSELSNSAALLKGRLGALTSFLEQWFNILFFLKRSSNKSDGRFWPNNCNVLLQWGNGQSSVVKLTWPGSVPERKKPIIYFRQTFHFSSDVRSFVEWRVGFEKVLQKLIWLKRNLQSKRSTFSLHWFLIHFS